LWRLRATLGGRNLFTGKVRRIEGESWGFVLPPAVWCCVERRIARRALKPSAPLTFL
jgi:hypothetical protein